MNTTRAGGDTVVEKGRQRAAGIPAVALLLAAAGVDCGLRRRQRPRRGPGHGAALRRDRGGLPLARGVRQACGRTRRRLPQRRRLLQPVGACRDPRRPGLRPSRARARGRHRAGQRRDGRRNRQRDRPRAPHIRRQEGERGVSARHIGRDRRPVLSRHRGRERDRGAARRRVHRPDGCRARRRLGRRHRDVRHPDRDGGRALSPGVACLARSRRR